jgi:hypothetical protein
METNHPNGNWEARCAQDAAMSQDDRLRLLTEILSAGEEQADALGRLAQARACQAEFRCAAIDRLVQLQPDVATRGLLFQLFDDPAAEPDEQVRAAANVAFRYLNQQIVEAGGEALATRSAMLAPPDPSPLVQWLMSLDD